MSDQIMKDLEGDVPLTKEGQQLLDMFGELGSLHFAMQQGGAEATAQRYIRARILRARVN